MHLGARGKSGRMSLLIELFVGKKVSETRSTIFWEIRWELGLLAIPSEYRWLWRDTGDRHD